MDSPHVSFPRQRIAVVPDPAIRLALKKPGTRRLTVSVAGYFPNAADHHVSRPNGIGETVVIVCTGGTGWARIGATTHRVSARTALVIPEGLPHAYGSGADRPWTIWWCHLRGTDVAELVQSLEVTEARPTLPIRALDRGVALLEEIVSGLERDQSPVRLLGTSGAAWKLLTQLNVDRIFPEEGDPLERAMQYLADRLDGSVSVPELARIVGISTSRLGALFRKATGGGVLAHHTALRMSRARQLLDVTEAPVSEIAREVGYDDPLYFSRQFHRHHGISPSAYRNRD
jgi:AraC-like DNA-binding protein